jgi:hypothetical protein
LYDYWILIAMLCGHNAWDRAPTEIVYILISVRQLIPIQPLSELGKKIDAIEVGSVELQAVKK